MRVIITEDDGTVIKTAQISDGVDRVSALRDIEDTVAVWAVLDDDGGAWH